MKNPKETKKDVKRELAEALSGGQGPKVSRFALSVISGLIPFAGGVVGGAAGSWSEKEQDTINNLLKTWIKLQEEELKEIGKTLIEVMIRIDETDKKTRERLESKEYLSILKKCFRDWNAAESEYKRILIRNLLVNSASTDMCTDDLIRLFVEWIGTYSEGHFKVIGAIYNEGGITRKSIWDKVDGEEVREDSAKADLFKLIIDELSIGHIIRQHREVNIYGEFVKTPSRPRSGGSTMKSAFADDKEYELTGLGKWFVHYTMNEVVPKIADTSNN